MQEFQQRVVLEHDELTVRLTALSKFINQLPAFTQLPEDEQTRLRLQAGTMNKYAQILEQRIAHF